VAKEQAGQLGQTAKDSGRQVAATATEQAKGVADETRRQAKDLTREVASQVNEQAAAQKEKATGALRGLSDELRSMAAHNQQSGPASDLANQAADKLGEVARWLDQREPGHLVEEVRNVARRKPGAFLVGRLTRGAVQSARNDDPDDGVVTNGFVAETYPDESTPIGTAAAAETEVLIVEDAPVASGGYAQGQVR
jgi:hypothetical protein